MTSLTLYKTKKEHWYFSKFILVDFLLSFYKLPLKTLILSPIQQKIFHRDQQIARHFVHYSECLSNPPSHLSNSNNTPFLIQGSRPITIKG
jgi:hypothetical protein